MSSPPRTTPSLVGKTVVLIENESITMMYLRKLLLRAGLTVLAEATTGRDGIESVQRCSPDMVLLDTTLPDMDAAQVSSQLRRSPSCLVVLTCVSDELSEGIAVRAGADGYISKPAGSELILSRLEQICGRN